MYDTQLFTVLSRRYKNQIYSSYITACVPWIIPSPVPWAPSSLVTIILFWASMISAALVYTYTWEHVVFVFGVRLTSHLIWFSSAVLDATDISRFLFRGTIFHRVNGPPFLYLFMCWWTLNFRFVYCDYCCSEQWSANVGWTIWFQVFR